MILNYIFTELNNKNDKIKEEAKELIQLQELNSQRNSKKSKTQKTFSFFQKSSFHQSYKKIIEKNISSISDNESDSENSINSNDKQLNNNENIDNLKVCFQGEYNYLYSPFNDMKSRNKFEKKSASELILFNFKKRLNTQFQIKINHLLIILMLLIII